jgi:hypothetical protein
MDRHLNYLKTTKSEIEVKSGFYTFMNKENEILTYKKIGVNKWILYNK